jgi:two-component system response regulator DesR
MSCVPPITLAIADHEEGMATLRKRLRRDDHGISVISQSATSREAIGGVARLAPRVLLCGFHLAAAENFLLLHSLRLQCPATRILLLTDNAIEAARIIDALAVGVRGYLDRNAPGLQLANAIRRVDAGEVWVPRQMLGRIFDEIHARSQHGRFQSSGVHTCVH